MTITLSDKNFEVEVIHSDCLNIVFFWAEWVGSCHIITPVLEEVGRAFSGRIKVGKINFEEHKKVSRLFGINTVPTILFFKDGEVVGQHAGIISKKDLSKIVTSLF